MKAETLTVRATKGWHTLSTGEQIPIFFDLPDAEPVDVTVEVWRAESTGKVMSVKLLKWETVSASDDGE